MSTHLNRAFSYTLADYLTSSAATFVDPVTLSPLCEGGEQVASLSCRAKREQLERFQDFYLDAKARIWP